MMANNKSNAQISTPTPLCFVMETSVDSCSGKHETMFKQEFLSMLWLINSISRIWLNKPM